MSNKQVKSIQLCNSQLVHLAEFPFKQTRVESCVPIDYGVAAFCGQTGHPAITHDEPNCMPCVVIDLDRSPAIKTKEKVPAGTRSPFTEEPKIR